MRTSYMQPQRLSERWSVDRIGPLGLIVFLHIGLFYSLRSGLPQPTAEAVAVPKELFATLITPQPAIQPATPRPPLPKPLPQRPPPKTTSTPPIAKTSLPLPSPPASSQSVAAAAVVPPASTLPATPAAPAAAPAPVTPAPPKTITSGVEYIQQPRPEYPAMSRRLGEQGKVVLRILVNDKGRPERIDLQQSSGSARLDEAARQAVQHALFKPHIEDGKAVAVYAIVPIKFELDT
jgi:periplasmic protein TonB